jgi:isocitrate lyase
MYPDQSLYPVDSVPKMVERINNSFERADQIQWAKGINPGDRATLTTTRRLLLMQKQALVAY